jgi:hypothetical protein
MAHVKHIHLLPQPVMEKIHMLVILLDIEKLVIMEIQQPLVVRAQYLMDSVRVLLEM